MSEPEKPKQPKSRLAKDLLRVAGIAVFFVALAIALKQPYVRNELLDINHLRQRFQGKGLLDELMFIGAAALVNALGVPRIWVCAMAGTIYGAIWGSVVSLVATMIGSSIDFVIGRSVLRGPIKRQMPERLRPWYKLFNKHGFSGVLYMRMFPLSNATVTNLVGGASKVSFRNFFLATLVGYIPYTIIFATFGSSAAKQSPLQLVFGIVLFLAVVLATFWWKKRHAPPAELQDNPDKKDQ